MHEVSTCTYARLNDAAPVKTSELRSALDQDNVQGSLVTSRIYIDEERSLITCEADEQYR